ncbi:tripartite tricarboxylate transporter substrate-binding protein [Cupriavidus alkaliphilus]|uniref:Tripartite-type tricarboxylate transporter receptor subunit TctC n=1 Tax=Cupriavidus alkaliphilus TaxID=942866 RepID=A0A7W4VE57_9BURK|nr:tripartite tricarboxylate transporter substrate-binding protein [Cupriavidus alkaliphilus]MBB3009965.1 tripartite-type tricarboxylate transporter receptor subunit TctC [Cupriavidus alkaliphilus]GLC96679.1 hypothetical protein Tamer19_60880 [Cupriavidus sp. TA19]
MTASDLSVPRRRLLQAAALLAFTTARGAHSQPDKAAFPRRPVRIMVGYPAGQTVSGKIKVLAVSSKARYRALPNVPTVAEQGVPDFEVVPAGAR